MIVENKLKNERDLKRHFKPIVLNGQRFFDLDNRLDVPFSHRDAEALWVNDFTDPFNFEQPFFIPINSPGAWITPQARSIMVRTEGGYLQYKGAGNLKEPWRMPITRALTGDSGHRRLWAVDFTEVVGCLFWEEELTNCGITCDRAVEIVRLKELPIPTQDGGVQIVSVENAFLTKWPIKDHLRKEELVNLRGLAEKKDGDDVTRLSDAELVQEYAKFYQMKIERALPFKNNVFYYLDSPLLLAHLINPKKKTLADQASAIVAVLREFGRATGISEAAQLEQVVVPADLLESLIVDEEAVSDNDADSVRSPLEHVDDNRVSQKAWDLLTDGGKQVKQIIGHKYVRLVLSQLSSDALLKLHAAIESAEHELIENYVRSIINGLSLSQSVSAKDVMLGRVSDVGPTVQRYKPGHDVKSIFSVMRKAENYILQNMICLGKVYGLGRDFNLFIPVMQQKIQSKIDAICSELVIEAGENPKSLFLKEATRIAGINAEVDSYLKNIQTVVEREEFSDVFLERLQEDIPMIYKSRLKLLR